MAVLISDLDNTLVNTHQQWLRGYDYLVARYRDRFADETEAREAIIRLADALFNRYGPESPIRFFETFITLITQHPELGNPDESVEEILDREVARINREGAFSDRAAAQRFYEILHAPEPLDGLPEFLDFIAASELQLCIVTHGWEAGQRKKLRDHDIEPLLSIPPITTAALGTRDKLRLYREAIDQLKHAGALEPPLFVLGDNPEHDLKPARSLQEKSPFPVYVIYKVGFYLGDQQDGTKYADFKTTSFEEVQQAIETILKGE
ncbi:MAG: HAD family hydrolase [Candidatus Bipolaricaulia bacterium]